MRSRIIHITLLLELCLTATLHGQAGSVADSQPKAVLPSYSVSFHPGDPVPGVGSVFAMRLPFDCTPDGTVFITSVQPLGVGDRPGYLAKFAPSMLLISVSTSGVAHSFPLNQIPNLYDISEIGHYVSDSKVIFLLHAAHGDVSAINAQNALGSSNAIPDHHFYAVTYDREGTYQKTVQLGDDLRITQLGLFPTGNYLAYGYDKNDHSPKLALLKDDGTLLKYLDIQKEAIPQSAVGTLNGSGKGPAVYVAPIQFFGRGHSIYILQNKTELPILEVGEAGNVREIRSQLLNSEPIQMLIPSDGNLYAQVEEAGKRSIYELNTESGEIIRHLQISGEESVANVACVNGDKFLSFENTDGKLVPLAGTAQPNGTGVQSAVK